MIRRTNKNIEVKWAKNIYSEQAGKVVVNSILKHGIGEYMSKCITADR